MTTSVQIKPNLSPNVIKFGDRYYELTKTDSKGTKVALEGDELERVKVAIIEVVNYAITEGPIDTNTMNSFDYNTSNKTFYAYSTRSGESDGSHADKWVLVSEKVAEAFANAISPKSNSDNKTSSATSSKKEVVEEEDFKWEDIKKEAIENFSNPRRQIEDPSLTLYSRMLEEQYHNVENRIRISYPVIIQNLSKFKTHPMLLSEVNAFNLNSNLKTLYIPIHTGSSKGDRTGHWTCAALTRNVIRSDDGCDHKTSVIVYDSYSNHSDFSEELKDFLERATKATLGISSEVKHQHNGIDCGVHVLHFINTMENSHFLDLGKYMKDPNFKPDIKKERETITKKIRNEKDKSLFNPEKGSNDIRTVQDHHLAKLLKPSKNHFVGLYELQKIQTAQLSGFKSDPESIKSGDYDPWMFPSDIESNYGRLYAIDDVHDRKYYKKYIIKNIIEGTKYVLSAYGWKLEKVDEGYIINPFGRNQYKIPPERLVNMTRSFNLFEENEIYDALVEFREINSKAKKIVQKATPEKRISKIFKYTNVSLWSVLSGNVSFSTYLSNKAKSKIESYTPDFLSSDKRNEWSRKINDKLSPIISLWSSLKSSLNS